MMARVLRGFSSGCRAVSPRLRYPHAANTISRSMSIRQEHLDFCVEEVRSCDNEFFISILYAPRSVQPSLMTVRAFMVELGRVLQNASDPNISVMKLQWWREALNDIYKQDPPRHPMAVAVAQTMADHDLGKRHFAQMIDARIRLLQGGQPFELADLEAFAEGAYASNLYLNLQIMGAAANSQDSQHAASHIGKALGLMNIIKTCPYFASKRRIYLPATLMAEYNVSSEFLFKLESTSELGDVIYTIANTAFSHIDHARQLSLPADAVPALQSLAIVDLFLKKLQRADFNVFHPSLQKEGNLKLHARLLKTQMQGKL